jgi:electron transfer flavoprotein alpha subunit
MGAREIATISAPDGPAKVPPTATAEAGADKPDAAVLDRHENAQVKHVVSHQEQAVEPKVEPRVVYNGAAPSDADSAVAPTGPQPKKIKTVSVRPDGSIIANAIVPPAVVKAAGAAPRDAAAKHAATTPTSTTKPAQKIAAVEAAVEENAEVKAPATTHKIDKGAFAVQFGAAATEAEAHALVTKVATKYGAQLGGHRPTFRMAKVGDKTVYRVRVGGMSKESAASVCGNVKSSGGSCFIAGD